MCFKTCKECGETKLLSEFSPKWESGQGKHYRLHSCDPCRNAARRSYRRSNYTRYYRHHKNSSLKSLYGITIDDYDEMYDDQEGCCAICGTHQSELRLALQVDHCHDTGIIRGLLCGYCNSVLGYMGDDPEVLDNAAAYLRRK